MEYQLPLASLLVFEELKYGVSIAVGFIIGI